MQLDLFNTKDSITVTTEEWADIPGYARYQASTMGRFKQKSTGKLLGGTVSHNGYIHIGLTVDGKQVVQLAHRLVALVFLVQPSPLHCVVNHKNKVRSDNRLSNLEWFTRSQNSKHAWLK